MTRRILHNALAAVVALAAIGANAETEVVDGYTWSYRINGDTAEIVTTNGKEARAVDPEPEGCVTIPATLGGYPVTSIGNYALAGCVGITGVSIPSGVTSIKLEAFYGCTGLKSITIPDSVKSVGKYVFEGCISMKSAVIGNGVKSIGMSAFADCTGLASVTLGASLYSLDDYAFGGCSSLKSVVFYGNKLGSMGWNVFSGVADGCTAYIRADVDWGKNPSGFLELDVDYIKYSINFHRNDASNGNEAMYDFDYGVATRLPSLNSLGWARRGFDFKGWATSVANAAAGKVWKADQASIATAAGAGAVLDVYAVWALKPGYYAVYFVRNDGAGTWRTVGFPYGEKTRMPTLAKGLGWARRGYAFNGWALTAANANNGVIWMGDWANIATPVEAGSTLTVYASWSLKPGYYQVRYNKNDGTGKWRTLGFECGVSGKLNTIAGLGWTRAGHPFKGWASNKANADAGKVWKADGAWVKDATAESKTLSIYAIWQ